MPFLRSGRGGGVSPKKEQYHGLIHRNRNVILSDKPSGMKQGGSIPKEHEDKRETSALASGPFLIVGLKGLQPFETTGFGRGETTPEGTVATEYQLEKMVFPAQGQEVHKNKESFYIPCDKK